jgi:hypothetical protein
MTEHAEIPRDGTSSTATLSGGIPTTPGLSLPIRNARSWSEKIGVDKYLTAKFYEGRLSVDEYNDRLRDLWGSA